MSFFISHQSFARDIPVNIKADKLRFIEGTGIVIATGSVEVKLKEVVIHADVMHMDSATKVATAEGNVKIFTRDYRAMADYIYYNATSEVTAFSGFKSRLAPKKLKGPLYISAQKLDDLGEKMMGEAGELTTCEDEIPHYFAVASKVEYYPDDKIIGYNVVLFMGETPVFWLPIFYYDLNEKGRRNWAFGHNEVEGDYVKSAWGVPWGILYLDQMEKKGFGQGTALTYGLWGLGGGLLYLYHVDEKDTGITDWITKIDHVKQFNPWTTLKLKHRYTGTYLIPSGRKDQTELDLNLSYKNNARWNLGFNNFDDRIAFLQKYNFRFNQAYEKMATNYSLYYDFSKKDPEWIRSSQRFSHRRPLTDKIMFSARVNYYNSVADGGAPGDEKLEPVVDITGREPGFSWRVSENWYIDLDEDTFSDDDNYQYLEKLPEVEIIPNPYNFDYFTLSPKFSYGYYHEVRYTPILGGNRSYATERYKATLNANKNMPLGQGTVLNLGAGLDQYLYAPGDQMYAYRERMSLNTNLGGFFRNNINYRKGSTDGNTPFMFDQLGSYYHNVREKMEFYHRGNFRWTLDGGYNWQTHKWFDVMTHMFVRPDQRLYWNVRTGWSIEERKYRDLINNLTLMPASYFKTTFQSVSDMNIGKFKSGSIIYNLLLLEGQPNQWQIKLSQIYDSATDQFKMRDIMVVKDLHCWELKYTYSDFRKEFSLVFSLKAMPDEPMGLSTGRGFYFDSSLEKEFKDLKPEGAIERY